MTSDIRYQTKRQKSKCFFLKVILSNPKELDMMKKENGQQLKVNITKDIVSLDAIEPCRQFWFHWSVFELFEIFASKLLQWR